MRRRTRNYRPTVSVKFLCTDTVDDEEVRARSIREAQSASSLDHPKTCPVYGILLEQGRTFIVMVCVARRCRCKKRCTSPPRCPRDSRKGAKYGAGHSDTKPSNVMLDSKGRVKIMDFGLVSRHWRSDEARHERHRAADPGLHVARADQVQNFA